MSCLAGRVPGIVVHQERLVEEDLFTLRGSNAVLLPVLVDVAIVPLESDRLRQRIRALIHRMSILQQYTRTGEVGCEA
jgi:hypothetical protein